MYSSDDISDETAVRPLSVYSVNRHRENTSVSVVVVFHNGKEQTLRCLKSVKSLHYPNFDVTVVDDGSTDGSSEAISGMYPDISILRGDGNLWCNGSFNLAIGEHLKKGSKLFLLLNNDNVISPDALGYLVQTHQSLNAPIVGSLVGYLHKPDTVSYAGKRIDWKKGQNILIHNAIKIMDVNHEVIDVDFLGFQGVLIGREVFEKVGLFDDKTFKHYSADADFYLRAKRMGFKVLVDTRSVVWDDVNIKGPVGPSPKLIEFIRNLKSVKSISHLPTRYRFYRRHSPVFWLRPFGKYYLRLLKGQLTTMVKYRLTQIERPIRKSLAKLSGKAANL